jgi:3-oxoacyl-[acyl-carrier protein] reductase
MKTCVITGASQGIGRATAVRLSREPAVGSIAIIARNAEALDETVSLMDTETTRVAVHPFDLTDLGGIGSLVDFIHEDMGSFDMLLNVAGYAEPCSLLDTSTENIEQTFRVNVFATLVMTRECVRHMRERPAKILNVASTAGSSPRPGWVAYAASKAAVVSLSTSLADELAEYGIKVYSVSPGRCATELREKLAPEEDPTTIMQPDQVAEVIANLLSDDESSLDGQDIIVRQPPRIQR